MDQRRISEALREATDTKDVVIGDGVIDGVGDVFRRCFGDEAAVVIADENTLEVAGERAARQLESGARETLEPFVFPGRPVLHADYENIEKLIEALHGHRAIPVAVGSGTVNDIVKRAARECERPYMCVATAASMDGYTSFGASITKDGFKQTMECSAPRAVVADLAVLMKAPARMTSSGYADLLAKITAGADWIVADALEVEAIKPKERSLVQEPLREATGRPADLHGGDSSAMEGLIEGLIMSGLAMQAASSSRPASGAEHQFSHLWEMEGLGEDDEPPLSHGFKVGLGTVSISALYERVLARDYENLDVDAAVGAWPSRDQVEQRVRQALAGTGVEDDAVRESLAKYVESDELGRRLALLGERWPELRERLHEQLLAAEQVRKQLEQARCPTTPAEVGLSTEHFKTTYRRAQMIRRRYTVLDLTNE
ncbi:MAG: sn-glycerol-1-phosphate dehydrogenase, partial [Solirubrobacterales bacterium]|nr:sn-glycerol-1-phosphate dehydrogenase [Solirubrobacterales bacterium]